MVVLFYFMQIMAVLTKVNETRINHKNFHNNIIRIAETRPFLRDFPSFDGTRITKFEWRIHVAKNNNFSILCSRFQLFSFLIVYAIFYFH